MAEKKQFYCLRCQHRFLMDYQRQQVVERTCPKCGSNSVRLAPSTPKAVSKGTGGE